MTSNMNVLRSIRLQLKSGYMKKAPEAYTFLRRYPPLGRDTAAPIRQVETRNIPYLHLYEKTLEKNPLYFDEKVYPAYWAHEPEAMTLAKKWYEFQQTGMDEKEAYNAAKSYVEKLEDKSYTIINEIVAELEKDSESASIHMSFLSQPEIAKSIEEWRAKLAATNDTDTGRKIAEMKLSDQAELDYFIQTKILKWNEVERERRMRDPLFERSFVKLRSHITGTVSESFAERSQMVQEKVLKHFDVHKFLLQTEKPFFFDDYAAYFEKLKEEPLLGRWSEEDRVELSHWIIDTLAYRYGLRFSDANHIQSYLDQLRAHFFPMVRYPKRAAEFHLPSEEEIRRILYNNNVGYHKKGVDVAEPLPTPVAESDNENGDEKEEVLEAAPILVGEGKLYVKRFYKIPQLLFPKETLTTTLTADSQRLKTVLSEENGLLNEIARAGHSENAFPELENELRDFMSSTQPSFSLSGMRSGGGDSLSSLDALLRDDDDEVKQYNNSEAPTEGGADDDDNEDEEGDEGMQYTSNEWQSLIHEYVGTLDTALAKERDAFWGQDQLSDWQDSNSEDDLIAFRRERDDHAMIIRSRLGQAYDKKEAARLEAEWRGREMVLEELPNAELEIIDNSE